MQTDGKAAAKVVEFAKKFHDETFIKDDKSFFTTYMETTTGDRNTLAHVDLTSTVSQITWGSMAAAQYTNPVIALKEINDSYDVVTIDYVMSCVDGKGETEYYNVREYFRLRQTESRMYVLNYERTANQIFNSENSFISDSGSVMLGIRSSEAEYRANEAGSVICFVQEGDLYSYDINNGMIIKVFSFRDAEGIDERENWNHHDIKIVSVDEAGSIDSKTSYEVLKAEMGKMLYLNEKNEFYLMMDDSLYRINLGSMSVKKVVEGLSTGSYCASESNRYFAWVDSANQYSSNTIKVMDLKNGKTFEIKKGNDQYLRPLGFIGEDFIYGQANVADVVSDAAGNTTFPMNGLIILDTSDQSELKTYTPSGGYVEKISVDGYTVTIDLIAQNNGVYAEIGQDTIMNREADSKQKIALDTSQSDTKLTVSAISIAGGKKPDKLKQLTAQMTINSHDTTVDLKFDDNTVHFYVYAKGDVIFASDNISDAIKQANDSMGVVIDSNQQYVWMRARKNAVNAFANIACNETDKDADSVVKSVSAMLTYNDVTVSVSELIGAVLLMYSKTTCRTRKSWIYKECLLRILSFISARAIRYLR